MQFLFGEIYIFTFLHQLRFPPLKIYIHVYFTKKNLQECIYVSFIKFAPGTFQGPEGYRIRIKIFLLSLFATCRWTSPTATRWRPSVRPSPAPSEPSSSSTRTTTDTSRRTSSRRSPRSCRRNRWDESALETRLTQVQRANCSLNKNIWKAQQ